MTLGKRIWLFGALAIALNEIVWVGLFHDDSEGAPIPFVWTALWALVVGPVVYLVVDAIEARRVKSSRGGSPHGG